MWYGVIWYDTRWQKNSKHLHTNNTQNTQNATHNIHTRATKVLRKWRKTSNAKHLTDTFWFHRTKLYSLKTFTEIFLLLNFYVKLCFLIHCTKTHKDVEACLNSYIRYCRDSQMQPQTTLTPREKIPVPIEQGDIWASFEGEKNLLPLMGSKPASGLFIIANAQSGCLC
jgi:hypothetical protein